MKKTTDTNRVDHWAQKAYENLPFLNSVDARPIRVLCEFVEPGARFRRFKVKNTICFFGSARARHPGEIERDVTAARVAYEQRPSPDSELAYEQARHAAKLSRYYVDAMELARRIAEWSHKFSRPSQRFHICTGGGPGIMEAANRGASLAGAPSIGLNISLPFEQHPNPYQTPELAFEFHYFFVRKFWFMYMAKALVAFPGGFGTFDEVFELLTLIQTEKIRKKLPIVLFGKEFWDEVVDFDALARWGVISPRDLALFHMTDDIDDAEAYLVEALSHLHRLRKV